MGKLEDTVAGIIKKNSVNGDLRFTNAEADVGKLTGFTAFELTAIRKAIGDAELTDKGSGVGDFVENQLARFNNAYMDFLSGGDKAVSGTGKRFLDLSPQTQDWIKENQ